MLLSSPPVSQSNPPGATPASLLEAESDTPGIAKQAHGLAREGTEGPTAVGDDLRSSGSSTSRRSSSTSGTERAPSIWPAANSSAGRTSTSTSQNRVTVKPAVGGSPQAPRRETRGPAAAQHPQLNVRLTERGMQIVDLPRKLGLLRGRSAARAGPLPVDVLAASGLGSAGRTRSPGKGELSVRRALEHRPPRTRRRAPRPRVVGPCKAENVCSRASHWEPVGRLDCARWLTRRFGIRGAIFRQAACTGCQPRLGSRGHARSLRGAGWVQAGRVDVRCGRERRWDGWR
jgi:hypothetical protein